jgi:hypothetical protein
VGRDENWEEGNVWGIKRSVRRWRVGLKTVIKE